ncbi:Calmodulin [Hondaea fermentalgiana]|uniref:Calmodulin n=1 Tax=Hondaea fermentalgiana TaxID=2315210 RepID=A0A2R5GB78_9STRA|nr:Calmodulin [Hondaea fermentalgiana]|eukprot:GBG28250.1 Calmodulin [Hondaea fermentalgiana]
MTQHSDHGSGKRTKKDLVVQGFTELLSGIVNGLLMLSFCYVFSSLIFGTDEGLAPYIPVGAAQQITSAAILGLTFATYSDSAVTIAGPDINPTIFFATAAEVIRQNVDQNHPNASDDERTQIVLTTVLITIVFGTALVSVLFYSLGHFRLTRVVQFVPAAVLGGFLAAVGVIVIIKAVKSTVGDELPHHLDYWEFWALLAPSVPIGVALYCTKRFHIGAPIVTIPCLLFGPFILFYIVVFGLGYNLDDVREMNLCHDRGHGLECGWLYDKYDAVLISDQWKFSFGQSDLIDWSAFTAALPNLFIMLIIVTLDSLLKIAGTKKKLGITDLDYDHEMQLGGKAHFFLVFLVGAPGYGQLKFNALNSGIIRNTKSRWPGVIAGLFNAGLWFAGFPLINYLPRFFIGALLIYAGLGFIVENLIDTLIQDRFSLLEYLTVWAIVILSQTTSLLVAVIVGVMASFVLFAVQYSKTGVVKAVLSGSDFQSSVVRSSQEDAKLEHLSSQVVIIKLKRYIFFGSANQITELVWSILDDVAAAFEDEDDEEADLMSKRSIAPHDGLLHTLVFDFEDVYGIDFTACGTLMELLQQLIQATTTDSNSITAESSMPNFNEDQDDEPPHSFVSRNPILRRFRRARRDNDQAKGFTILFTGMSTKVYRRLHMEGVIQLLHKSGYPVGPTPAEVDQVLPKVLAMPRAHRLVTYMRKILGPLRPRRTKAPKGEPQETEKDFLDDDESPSDMNDIGAQMPQSNSNDIASEPGGQELNLTTPDYYANGDFSPALRRVFPTLDLAMEWVEERLLERASTIRQRWLVFSESFRRLHELARLKAQHEPFEHILGGHLGDSVWKYVQTIRVPSGARLLTAGQVNPHLFLLQHGRLTSYMVRNDDSMMRLQSHRRGAFINEDALFVEYPVSHTVIADEDCTLLALSRESLKTLEMHKPEVAFEIHRNVLRLTARARNRLARELDVVDHWSLFERQAVEDDPIQTAYMASATRASSIHHRSSSHHFAPTQPMLIGTSQSRSSSFFGGHHSHHHGHQSSFRLSHHSFSGRDHSATPPPLSLSPSQKPKSQQQQQPPHSAFDLESPIPESSRADLDQARDVPSITVEEQQAQQNQMQQQQQQQKKKKQLQQQGQPQDPQTHLRSTSRKVGRAIMNEAAAAYKKEAARKEKFLKFDTSHSKTVPPLRSEAPGAQDYGLEEMVQRIANDDPSSSKGRNRSGSSRGNGRNNSGAGDGSYARRHSERNRMPSRTSSMHHDRSLSFRPDLRHDSFLHAPPCDEGPTDSVDANETRRNIHLSRIQELDAVACFKRAASNRFHARGKRPGSDPERDGAPTGSFANAAPDLSSDDLEANGAQAQGQLDARINRAAGAARQQQQQRMQASEDAQPALAGLFSTSLSRSRLRQTLMDMGHFPSDHELDNIMSANGCASSASISEKQFLGIVRALSLEELTDEQIYGFALFFQRHAQRLTAGERAVLPSTIPVLPDMVLTVQGLKEFLDDIGHVEDPLRLEKMFAEWSDFSVPSTNGQKPFRALHFASLCSMMAWHIHAEKLFEEVAQDFGQLTVGGTADELVYAEDIVHVMSTLNAPCTWDEATEMVFEADLSANGGVSYEDLVETLTTVFDAEIEPQLEQLNQDILDADQVIVRSLTNFHKKG